jgi:hypothetical protein
MSYPPQGHPQQPHNAPPPGYSTPPAGPPPGYAGPQGPPPYGYGGGSGGPPPRRTGLIAVIGGVLAVVIAAVVIVVVIAQGNDDGESSGPDATRTEPGQSSTESTSPSASAPANAEAAVLAVGKAYAAAVNRSDKQAATNLMCEKTSPGAMYEAGAGEAQYQVGEVEILNPTTATVGMITVGASGRAIPLPFSLKDTWCVAV